MREIHILVTDNNLQQKKFNWKSSSESRGLTQYILYFIIYAQVIESQSPTIPTIIIIIILLLLLLLLSLLGRFK